MVNEGIKDIFKITKAPASERGRLHEPKGRGRALTDFTEYMKHCNDIIAKLEEEIEQAGGNNPKKNKSAKEKEAIRALRNQR